MWSLPWRLNGRLQYKTSLLVVHKFDPMTMGNAEYAHVESSKKLVDMTDASYMESKPSPAINQVVGDFQSHVFVKAPESVHHVGTQILRNPVGHGHIPQTEAESIRFITSVVQFTVEDFHLPVFASLTAFGSVKRFKLISFHF